MTDINHKIIEITVRGCIWRGGENVIFSVEIDGHYLYAQIPELEQRLREWAKRQSISVGDVCDRINSDINAAEKKRMEASGIPHVEMEFHLNDEQSSALRDMLFGKNE